MASNSGYNPDALPAHAEPEQAAAMLSGRPHASSVSQPPPQGRQHSGSLSQGYNKPPPTPNATSPHPPHPGAGRGWPSLSGASNPYGSPPLSHNPSYNNYPPRGAPYGISPPPQQYSQHPPPPVHHNRPPVNYRPPPTPAPPVNVPPPQAGAQSGDDSLFALFRAVDTDNSGRLDERELRSALVNGDWTSFDPHTVRMMIRMFDTERTGSISFDEFCGLWGFLAAWRTLFDRFDEDRSGNINLDEYSKALVAFGYRLTPPFISLLFKTYDKRAENAISFDLFVQSCISLKRMTDVFKRYDDDRDGYVTLSFEEFLTEILRQR